MQEQQNCIVWIISHNDRYWFLYKIDIFLELIISIAVSYQNEEWGVIWFYPDIEFAFLKREMVSEGPHKHNSQNTET